MSDEYYWGPDVRIEPPDPPTDPPEEPRREDGPCELCGWYSPLCDIEGERVELPGYEACGACVYDRYFPTLVDGAKKGTEQGCECFERRQR
jgi:hypothetical protein